MKLRILIIAVVVAAMSGCLQGSASSEGNGIDQDRLVAGWDSGQPHVAVIDEVDGETWQRGLFADPLVTDIDGNGRQELVAHGMDRKVHVIDAQNGRTLASLPVQYPPSWRVDQALNTPTLATLEPGAPPSLVVATPAAGITVWTYDPSASSGGDMAFEKAWYARADACHPAPGMDADPVVANIDGQPGKEILVHVEQMGLVALRNDGTELWHQCWSGGNSSPAAADLDGDGTMEVVFASDSGFISVLDGKTGEPEWTFDASDPIYGIKPASIVTAPTIADIDGKGPKEVLFTARNAPKDDPDAYEDFHMAIFAVHQDPETYQAELVWKQEPQWAHAMSNTRLLVEDVDGDGEMDIFGMDWNTIGHNPGGWEPFDSSTVFRLDSEGRTVWKRELPAWWSNKDILLSDADGDGDMEVLVANPRGSSDGIWRIDAADGRPEGFLTAGSWTLSSGPVDLGDGRIAVSATNDGATRSALIIYGGLA